MKILITFESHSTSVDNEAGTASGHHDCPLSELGRRQAVELGDRYRDRLPDGVYCSDLRRSWETGEIAFADHLPLSRDARLRECDYGRHTHRTSVSIAEEASSRIWEPFPQGESYDEVNERIGAFLLDAAADREEGHLMVIGHRATQYALEYFLNEIEVAVSIAAPWRWRPGWSYELNDAALLRLHAYQSRHPDLNRGPRHYE